jgi:hypothetical protein
MRRLRCKDWVKLRTNINGSRQRAVRCRLRLWAMSQFTTMARNFSLQAQLGANDQHKDNREELRLVWH